MGEGESKQAPEDEERPEDANGDGETDISDTPAPSIGPNTTFDKRSAEERLSGHEQSDLDAMGLEKRRQVIGGRYSASFTRQIVTYVIVLGVIVGAAFGLKTLTDDLDKPPAKVEDQAPWTGSDQKPANLE